MFTLAGGWVGGCDRVRASVWVCTHSVCVGAVGAAVCAEWQSHSRVEDAKLADHLLHAADGPLLIGVCELHYQTGGCSLRQKEKYGNAQTDLQQKKKINHLSHILIKCIQGFKVHYQEVLAFLHKNC